MEPLWILLTAGVGICVSATKANKGSERNSIIEADGGKFAFKSARGGKYFRLDDVGIASERKRVKQS